jgi:hypothetical protein
VAGEPAPISKDKAPPARGKSPGAARAAAPKPPTPGTLASAADTPRPAKPLKSRKKRPAPAKPGAPVAGLSVFNRVLLIAVEAVALVGAGLVATIDVLGRAAEWFSGTGLADSLLPFAGSVLVLALAGSGSIRLWLWARGELLHLAAVLPAVVALGIAAGAGGFASQAAFQRDLGSLRGLVGGSAEAGRTTVAHQVFAAYRRTDLGQMQRILERARNYLPAIKEAAAMAGVDAEVLVGLGATESSFYPRDSQDGGRGLFQITAPPQAALEFAGQALKIERPDLDNPRHNAYVAAATLRHYLKEMKGDLFLGLLAYNIGPENGGLRSVMRQYGARDFVTIQPYLKKLPSDYPIRVLTAALAFRLWRADGKLPRYEEGHNAVYIQGVGIPGLRDGIPPAPAAPKPALSARPAAGTRP